MGRARYPLLRHLGRWRGVQYKVRAVRAEIQSSLRYFGVDRYAAKLAFEEAVADGSDPELLSTDDFEMALAYAEGDI